MAFHIKLFISRTKNPEIRNDRLIFGAGGAGTARNPFAKVSLGVDSAPKSIGPSVFNARKLRSLLRLELVHLFDQVVEFLCPRLVFRGCLLLAFLMRQTFFRVMDLLFLRRRCMRLRQEYVQSLFLGAMYKHLRLLGGAFDHNVVLFLAVVELLGLQPPFLDRGKLGLEQLLAFVPQGLDLFDNDVEQLADELIDRLANPVDDFADFLPDSGELELAGDETQQQRNGPCQRLLNLLGCRVRVAGDDVSQSINYCVDQVRQLLGLLNHKRHGVDDALDDLDQLAGRIGKLGNELQAPLDEFLRDPLFDRGKALFLDPLDDVTGFIGERFKEVNDCLAADRFQFFYQLRAPVLPSEAENLK